jgi:hypothetical protein
MAIKEMKCRQMFLIINVSSRGEKANYSPVATRTLGNRGLGCPLRILDIEREFPKTAESK